MVKKNKKTNRCEEDKEKMIIEGPTLKKHEDAMHEKEQGIQDHLRRTRKKRTIKDKKRRINSNEQ